MTGFSPHIGCQSDRWWHSFICPIRDLVIDDHVLCFSLCCGLGSWSMTDVPVGAGERQAATSDGLLLHGTQAADQRRRWRHFRRRWLFLVAKQTSSSMVRDQKSQRDTRRRHDDHNGFRQSVDGIQKRRPQNGGEFSLKRHFGKIELFNKLIEFNFFIF